MEGMEVAVGTDPASTGSPESGPSSSTGAKRARPSDFSDKADTWNNEMSVDATGGGMRNTREDVDPSKIEKKLGGEQLQDPEGDQEQQLDAETEPEEQQGDPNDPRVAFKPYFDAMAESMSTGKPLDMKMFGDAPVVAKYKGKEITIPLKEALSSYQRQLDTTNKNKEVSRIAERAQHILSLEQQRNQQWRDHNILRRDLRAMGLGEVVDRLVMAEAEEKVSFRRLPQAEQQRILMAREMEARQQQWEAEKRHLMQQMQQQQGTQPDQVTAQYTQMLEATLPKAFAEAGIHDYGFSRRVFLENLAAEFDGSEPLTEDILQRAVMATKQYMDDHGASSPAPVQRTAAQQNGTRPGGHAGVNQALPPRRQSGNVGGNVRAFNPASRSKPSDFAGKYNL